MTTILPTVLPALPAAPLGASLTTIDASIVLLPLALVVAVAVALVVDHARAVCGGRRPPQPRRAVHVVAMSRAA